MRITDSRESTNTARYTQHAKKRTAQSSSRRPNRIQRQYFYTNDLPPYHPISYATSDPRLHPIAPTVATHNSRNVPSYTRYPANGMINSEGSGMHADSTAMRITIPLYPVAAITDLMKTKTPASIPSVMEGDR